MSITNEDKKLLNSILTQGIPMLFLGAGFSIGGTDEKGEPLPKGDQLKEEIYYHFIETDNSIDENDKKELRNMELRKLCEMVVKALDKEDALHNFLLQRFSHAAPNEYHFKLTDYNWKKIYTVNIDDIVETVYKASGKPLVVQNTNKKKRIMPEAVELVKIHGCVNNPDEQFVFSDSDYTSLLHGKMQYRLNDLTHDIQSNDFIFIGASLDEPDIKYYLSLYEEAGYSLGKGRIVFINPAPSYSVRAQIKKMNGHLIQATNEQFLNYIESLDYKPEELEKCQNRLEYEGIFPFKKIMNSLPTGLYESRLYEGHYSKWEDLRDNWLFKNDSYNEITKFIKEIDFTNISVFCIAIHGIRFCGKGCTLKLLASYLDKSDYDVLIYHGKHLDQISLLEYIKMSSKTNFALIINNAAFYYRDIENLLKKNLQNKRLLIICSSREYNHIRKKYYLEDNPYKEFQIIDRINSKAANTIYRTLKEKGYLGWLSRDKRVAVKQICSKKTLINLFSSITFGKGFRNRIHNDVKEIMNNTEICNLYAQLALIDKADLEYLPKELLTGKYELNFTKDTAKDSKNVVNYISYDSRGISLKNSILTDCIWNNTTHSLKLGSLLYILQNISKYVSEYENNYWRIIFESLTNEKWLEQKLKLKLDDILDLYYQLKNYYGEVSYYWLQLGIAEQHKGDYGKAQTHLDMAAEIRPNAYQIQHAIARNYLKHSINVNDSKESESLFTTGKNRMLELINSKEYYKKKAKDFSIHCYVSETMKYYRKWDKKPNKSLARELHGYIDKMNKEDDYYKTLLVEFAGFVKETGSLGYLNIHLGDDMLQAIISTNDEDIITESI